MLQQAIKEHEIEQPERTEKTREQSLQELLEAEKRHGVYGRAPQKEIVFIPTKIRAGVAN